MGDELSGGAKCIKYTLFLFNLLFLLAGLALVIIGAVVQVQAQKSGFDNPVSGAGIFLIVIGSIIFVVCFFGCAGAINNNYCMIVTFGIILLLLLLLEIAAVITGFVMKDKVKDEFFKQMTQSQKIYNDQDPENVETKTWNQTQMDLKCCGSTGWESWNVSEQMNKTHSVPDSCCKEFSQGCGEGKYGRGDLFWEQGCGDVLVEKLKQFLVYVGAAAAAVAVIELLGIVFAFCLAHSLRKDYRVV